MKARDIMTKNVVSVTPDCSIADMAATLQKFRVSGLPVINAGGALVGVVTEDEVRFVGNTAKISLASLDALAGAPRFARRVHHAKALIREKFVRSLLWRCGLAVLE